MPALPPCTLPSGRGAILLDQLEIRSCPDGPDLSTPELNQKMDEIELAIKETVDDLELVVSHAHDVDHSLDAVKLDLENTCVIFLSMDLISVS